MAQNEMVNQRETILEMKNVSYSFRTYGGIVQAVRDVSFDLRQGEILGLVGESGCGKSVTAQSIMRLNPEPPGFFCGGQILFKGQDITAMSEKELMKIRGSEIGYIFQDPMTSLNPTMRIGQQIEEVFVTDQSVSRQEAKDRAIDMMKKVGISDAEKRYKQYPHELSGGMKQRIMIAMALVSNPSMIICDEPTTSLDVTIEAQILDLLLQLREEFGTSIIMITHDLGVIARLCDRVVVMYGGKVVERGTVEEIFYDTAHPYTVGLMNSIAGLDTGKDEVLTPIEGTPPDLFSPPVGCPFAPRCEFAMKVCEQYPPHRYQLTDEHSTVCWLQHENAPKVDLASKKKKRGGRT